MDRMKIAITGVAGMIGAHLAELLISKEYQIYGIDNFSFGKISNLKEVQNSKYFNIKNIDILDSEALEKHIGQCEIIIHLAAIKKVSENQDSLPTLDVNTVGTKNILDLAKKNKIKVIFASTSDVYGSSDNLPFTEGQDLLIGDSSAKRWAYAVSKLYCEQLCFAYQKNYNMHISILRYFGGFSEKSAILWSGGHVPIFIDKLLNDETVQIHGDGLQTRSMAHASDLARGTYLALRNIEKCSGEIINIGNHEEISVLDTLYMIADELNIDKNKLKINYVPEKEIFGTYKDLRRRVPNLEKAKRILNYEPLFKFKDAIKLVIKEKLKSSK